MARAHAPTQFAVVLLALIVASIVSVSTFPYMFLYSTGEIAETLPLSISSFPNPSKIGQPVLISGLVTDDSGKGQSGLLITIQYSSDQYEWNSISTVWTDELGTYRTELKISSSGSYYFRAMCGVSTSSCRHLVADFLVAADGSGDFADIQMAIDALPSEGGAVYVRSGIYDLNPEVRYPYKSIVLRSNLILMGEGVDQTIIRVFPTKQPANSNVRVDGITSLDDIENLTVENLTLVQNGTPDNKGNSAVYLRCGNHKNIIIRNIKVTDAFGAGIAVPNFNNVVVENCVVDNVWTGVMLSGGSVGLVRGNTVTNTRGDGLFLRTNGEGLSVADVVIEDNYLENIGDVGIDITASSSFAPHERIVARNNTLKKAIVRVSHAIDIQLVNNTVEDGMICIDTGQGIPVNITVVANTVVSSASAGIGFYGAREAIVLNNFVQMRSPQEGVVQSGIVAAIQGTGLIQNNTILNAANYGISFGNWGLYGSSNITIRGNIILDFHDIGIYDDAKRQGGLILIEGNIIKDTNEPFISRYGIRTDFEENKWIIRKNQVYGGRIDFISAPHSDVYDNIYEP